MTLYHIAQQLLLLDHNQWKKTLNEDLNFVSNIKTNILCVFLLSNFFKKERKLFTTPETSFLMLEAKQFNSSATPNFFSIWVWKDGAIYNSQFQAHGKGIMKGIT